MNPKLLYVLIALTPLKFDNGLYTFLRGSHGTKNPIHTPTGEWNTLKCDLQPGDALIYRGDIKFFFSLYGGGKWQCMSFEWR